MTKDSVGPAQRISRTQEPKEIIKSISFGFFPYHTFAIREGSEFESKLRVFAVLGPISLNAWGFSGVFHLTLHAYYFQVF